MTDTKKAAEPCPFCGAVPDVSNDNHFQLTDGYKYGALVCGCGAQAPEVRTDYKEVSHWKAAAIDAWNVRAAASIGANPVPDVKEQ